jgi:hypothetical protein
MIGLSESWNTLVTGSSNNMAAIQSCGSNLGELLRAHEWFRRGAAE